MRKWITGGCSLLLLGCVGGSVANGAPQGSWGARADVLIERAMAADAAAGKTSKNPLDIGLLAAAIGQRQGFESANADHYLDRLLAVQLANGGFGLPYSFDSWGDGRVTPVGAAHTISMYQAGLALLPAYEAGVPSVKGALDRMVTKLASMPFVTVKPGKCMSYSDHPYDYIYGYCANNVNAAAADLLFRAHQAGFGVDPSWSVAAFTQYEVAAANRTWRNWTYSNASSRAQDPAHMAVTIRALMSVAPGIADNFVKYNLQVTGSDWRWPYAHAWLTPANCALGEQWKDSFDAWTETLSNTSDFELLSEAAYAASEAAHGCD
jgi:hypothetical protein